MVEITYKDPLIPVPYACVRPYSLQILDGERNIPVHSILVIELMARSLLLFIPPWLHTPAINIPGDGALAWEISNNRNIQPLLNNRAVKINFSERKLNGLRSTQLESGDNVKLYPINYKDGKPFISESPTVETFQRLLVGNNKHSYVMWLFNYLLHS